MKRFASIFLSLLTIYSLTGCNGSSTSTAGTDTSTVKTDSSLVTTGSTSGFKLGIQMWTFRMFSLSDALDKVDSSGIKNIEVFIGQNLGGGMSGKYGLDMSAETLSRLKASLSKHGIQAVAMGVIVPKNKSEWIKTFELAKSLGMSYVTAEPIKSQWDMVDSLAGVYGIPVAIHDHPKPNMY